MKIGIISDTHDNLANLEIFLDWAIKNNIETIIHCGDMTESDTLRWLSRRFSDPIKIVFGNVEVDQERFFPLSEKHLNIEVFKDIGQVKINNLNIAFVHQPEKIDQIIDKNDFDFIFYGHTHRPWIKQEGKTIIANPGTLGGIFNEPTFAVLDSLDGRLELKKLGKI